MENSLVWPFFRTGPAGLDACPENKISPCVRLVGATCIIHLKQPAFCVYVYKGGMNSIVSLKLSCCNVVLTHKDPVQSRGRREEWSEEAKKV